MSGDDFKVVPLARRDGSESGRPPRTTEGGLSSPLKPSGRRWLLVLGGVLVLAAGAVVVVALAAVWVGRGGPQLEPEQTPTAGVRFEVPQTTGPLSGLVLYVSAGHGYLLHREHHDGRPIRWGLQRDAWYGIIEDVYTAAFVADQLAPRLEEAGATVIALRERDRHAKVVLVDDTEEGFTARGWMERIDDDLAWGSQASRLKVGGEGTWRLTVPDEGAWYLYTRWVEGDDLDAQAIYTVVVGDQVSEVVVDQRAHGGQWWKLFDGCVPAGTEVVVTLTGSGGSPLSADAVRLGGGTLTWAPEPDKVLRHHPYFDVSFAHQHDWLGGPHHLGEYECANPRSDMRMRPNWVSWASPEGEEAAFLSIHTNGGRGQGAIVFAGIDSAPPTPAHAGSAALASFVEQEMVAAGQRVDPTYSSKGWRYGDYSEISPVHNTLPAALIELAFHDHPKDAARLRRPDMQGALAEGIVRGVVAWRQAGGTKAVPPTPKAP